ncbi:MAG: type II secretion system protein GspM [Pseudomonadota bacterium]
MKQLWQRYAGRYDALTRRERAMVLVAVLALIVVSAYVITLEPALARQGAAQRQIDQHQAELGNLRAQLKTIQEQARDPDVANRRQLEVARRHIAEIDERLRRMETTLVPPQRMAALLEEMLRRNHALELVSLRNLPATGLLQSKDGAATKEPGTSLALPAQAHGGDNGAQQDPEKVLAAYDGLLFKHGVEVTVTGGYGELLAYLAELEHMPQRMLWSSVKLTVEEYPRARLTFVVYTLSLDKAWLTV